MGDHGAQKMVERVARYVPNGDWLDIGVGNGSLLFTAAEWGYGAVATDLRTENVEKLRNLGFEAYSDDIENIAAIERFRLSAWPMSWSTSHFRDDLPPCIA